MLVKGVGARSYLSLLLHGPKVVDVVEVALRLGILARLDAGPTSLRALSDDVGAVPGRLHKFLDCLESAGLLRREASGDDILDATYSSIVPLVVAAREVLGADSIERDRDKYPWRALHGHLDDVLRGALSIPATDFDWPPRSADKLAEFEASMAAGIGPIVESFARAYPQLFPRGRERLLDVGGGDGSLVAALLSRLPELSADVYNLPAVRPLVEAKLQAHGGRSRFVGGDFFESPLPGGYDVIAFVRVLHDWPEATARTLLTKAYEALPAGGRIVICEEFRNADRLGVQFFWTYFLMGVDSCVSRLREVAVYARMLGELGASSLQIIPGPFDIITAIRPA